MSEPATLVLIHGCGRTHHFWDELRSALTWERVLAPSLPGRGEGEALGTTAAIAAWLRSWLREQSVRRPVVLGHSFGGGIALEYALSDAGPTPELAGLALVCTGARLRVNPAIIDAAQEAVRTGSAADFRGLVYRPDTDPGLVERIEQQSAEVPHSTTLRDWLATNLFDRMADLERVRVPTLVVSGTDDLLTPLKYGRYLAEHIAGAQLEVIEGGGHMLPVERPAELAGYLDRFMTRS